MLTLSRALVIWDTSQIEKWLAAAESPRLRCEYKRKVSARQISLLAFSSHDGGGRGFSTREANRKLVSETRGQARNRVKLSSAAVFSGQRCSFFINPTDPLSNTTIRSLNFESKFDYSCVNYCQKS
jgi:hypothetical protein